MTATPVTAIKIVFDKERKLKARHRYIRDAVIQSGKSIFELMSDPFGGYPYVLQALLQPGKPDHEVLDLNTTSRLIDAYIDKGGTIVELGKSMNALLESYMRIENTPTSDEVENDDAPNAEAPATSGAGD
jgi:hypothetical protein